MSIPLDSVLRLASRVAVASESFNDTLVGLGVILGWPGGVFSRSVCLHTWLDLTRWAV